MLEANATAGRHKRGGGVDSGVRIIHGEGAGESRGEECSSWEGDGDRGAVGARVQALERIARGGGLVGECEDGAAATGGGGGLNDGMVLYRWMGETAKVERIPSRNLMTEPIARIRIELQSIEPHVWRRVDVPVSSTLLALHEIIQIAMGWTDAHLFEFTVGGRAYGVIEPDLEYEPKQSKAASVRLKGLIDRGIDRFDYVYDFGDDWRHAVIIEEVCAGDTGTDYPAFVDGERRCPPEDVGNAEGFMAFLEAALVAGHPEHERMVAWYGKRFEFTDIDEQQIRAGLAELARQRQGARRERRPDSRDMGG